MPRATDPRPPLHGLQARVLIPNVLGSRAAGPEISAFAESHNVDLIVCGSRGLGAFKKGLLSLIGMGSGARSLKFMLTCAT